MPFLWSMPDLCCCFLCNCCWLYLAINCNHGNSFFFFFAFLHFILLGKRNIVTGVAKTIKEHFRKHPLAIVNVKGRAKGTSVQEVVAKLQVCTSEFSFILLHKSVVKMAVMTCFPYQSHRKQQVQF